MRDVEVRVGVRVDGAMNNVPPIVGSLFSWKSLLTNRKTREDCSNSNMSVIHASIG